MTLRSEQPADGAVIHRVVAAAFPTDAEARLVDRLRAADRLRISLVAASPPAGPIIGHIAFSPVSVDGSPATAGALGLAPVAVDPDHQRQGIGSALIRAGLDACRAIGCPFVVVLGDPAYYRRFGFTTAADVRLSNEYGAHEEFMVLEIQPGSLPEPGGLVRYAPEFGVFAE